MAGVWLIVVLLLAAMVLILLEIITPSFGILGALALACVAACGVVAFQYFGAAGGAAVVIGVVAFIPVYIVVLVRTLPKWGFGRKLFLDQADASAGAGPTAWLAGLVGKAGKTITPLRPIGTVIIEGRRYQASADSGYIPEGSAVKVVRFDGMEIIVRVEEDDLSGNSPR